MRSGAVRSQNLRNRVGIAFKLIICLVCVAIAERHRAVQCGAVRSGPVPDTQPAQGTFLLVAIAARLV